MSALYNDFVQYYTAESSKLKIRRTYEASWQNINTSKEVSAIKDYLLKKGVGVDFLNQFVAKNISNSQFDVKFASVFCHQKPRVRRTAASIAQNKGSTKSCELGDLLVLFVLLDEQDNLHYCSGSLFQAKVKPKLDSLSQQALYDFDADFNVPKYLEQRASSLTSYRKMPTWVEGRSKALRYLILEPHFSPQYVQARYSPWSNSQQLRASTFLDGLLSGSDGLKVDVANNPNGAWEIIVCDLLHTALMVPGNKPARGNIDAVKVATSHFNNFGNLNNYSLEIEDRENGGVPILMVIVQGKSQTNKDKCRGVD